MTGGQTAGWSGVAKRGAELGYRPALDGLRAVAVVAVMLYHGDVAWAAGGFLGVDVFFVLSGFLITSLLVQEWMRTGRIALHTFWLRRARRLLPAMLAVLVAVACYFLLVSVQQPSTLRGDFLATLAYVSNWWFVVSGQSYFDQFVEPSPLRHTWSLAIEEQFYLFFPLFLVVWLNRARLGLGALRWVLLFAVIASALLMAMLYEPLTDASRAYYGTDTRAQALLLGAILALLPTMVRPATPLYTQLGGRLVRLPGAGLVGWLALSGLVVLFGTARELSTWMYRGGFLLAAALSAAVIAAVLRAPRSSLGRVLSWRPVVAVGIVSYGLYLWHWPVYVALSQGRTGLDGWMLLGLRFLVTGVLAVLSYRFVEEPIRTQRMQRWFTPTQWARLVAACAAAVVAVTVAATASAPAGPYAGGASDGRSTGATDGQGRTVQAFLLGDSQSYGLRAYYDNQVEGLAVTGSTQLGCGTLLAERHVDGQTVPNLAACNEWESRWTDEVARVRPDIVVFMLGLGELYDRYVDGQVVQFGTPQYRDWLFGEIDRRRELVRGHARRFALTTALCMEVSSDAANRDGQIVNDEGRLRWLNDAIRAYGAASRGVDVIDLHGTVCGDGYQESVDGITLRDDGLHLNERGAELVWRQLGPAVLEAAE